LGIRTGTHGDISHFTGLCHNLVYIPHYDMYV
jgi:hypothetical protein